MARGRGGRAVDDGLFRALVDAVDDLVYVLDGDGRPVYWNEALEAATGYGTADIADLDPGELFRPSTPDADDGRHGDAGTLDLVDLLGEGTDLREVYALVTRDGEAIAHEVRGTTVADPESGETYRCAIARDVSGRVERERELARYETIVESVGDGVYALDEDLTITFVNDALCEILGRSREDLFGAGPRALFADDDEWAEAATMRERVVEGDRDTGVIGATTERSDGEQVELEARYRLLGSATDEEFPGSAGVVRDVTARNHTERELSRQRALLQGILNTIPDVVFAFDEQFEPLAPEFMLEEFAGYTADQLREMDPLDVVSPADRDDVAALMTDAMASGVTVSMESALVTPDGEEIPYEFRASRLEDDDGEVLGLVGTGRDVSRRVERERSLRKRRDELEALNRITELLLGITRDLVEKSSRRDLEATVCERLAASALYRFAWIGERELDGDGIRPRVSAGDDEGYVDGVTATGAGAAAPDGPTGGALRTGDVQTADVADGHVHPGHEAAPPADVESVAAVPLCHGETVYGVLAVYATRSDAFSEREQEGFRILGETVGFVINAVRRRKLLFADALTELELAVDATTTLPTRLSAALGCSVALDGYVDDGDRWLVYLDVEGAAADATAAWLADATVVERARVVADRPAHHRLEVGLADSTLLDAAATIGATVTEASATDGEGRAVLEVPADVDVRETVELLTDRLDGASLVAQRDRDRRPGRPGQPGGVVDDLTSRQRDALAVAYRAGYFEWPRESTAEEVAETLGVAPPTLHAHLRKAERRLLDALLDGA